MIELPFIVRHAFLPAPPQVHQLKALLYQTLSPGGGWRLHYTGMIHHKLSIFSRSLFSREGGERN